jgi:acetylornithine deacetylase/succinyl-diaminopimelate desuccinylase-like protein
MDVRQYIDENAAGFFGGHTGPGGKTIIPAQAHAKLSFRLVANQEPADVVAALRRYVSEHTPAGIEATVTSHGNGVRPSFSPMALLLQGAQTAAYLWDELAAVAPELTAAR